MDQTLTNFLNEFPHSVKLPSMSGAHLGECAEAVGNLREFDVQELGQIPGEPAEKMEFACCRFDPKIKTDQY